MQLLQDLTSALNDAQSAPNHFDRFVALRGVIGAKNDGPDSQAEFARLRRDLRAWLARECFAANQDGWTYQQLADATGMTRPSIQGLIRAERERLEASGEPTPGLAPQQYENNARGRALNADTARELRRRFAEATSTGVLPARSVGAFQDQLGEEFGGLRRQAVHRVVTGLSWSDAGGPIVRDGVVFDSLEEADERAPIQVTR